MQLKVLSAKKCKICSKKVKGRSDKKFCSIRCKNYYHINLNKVTTLATIKLDTILHRNRSILLELLGKKRKQLKINRLVLEQSNFKFKYHTHTHVNKVGKTMHCIYDFGWMEFSDNQILVVRN